jgi:Mn2+/Fe2+ NRAMP family transporter
MLTAVTTLHLHGVTDIATSSQAAQALRPIAGDFAFALFAAGIIGTGLLAVPVLAGSAAYGIAEALRWRIGLGLDLAQARGFYAIVIFATLLGVGLNFTPIDPIKALFWSAVINGVVAVPVMVVMMLMARRKLVMGGFIISRRSAALGWAATTVMAVMVIAMFATWGRT